MKTRRTAISTVIALLSITCIGCTGELRLAVTDGHDDPAADGPSTGSPATAGESCELVQVAPGGMKRLSARQLRNAVRDSFETPVEVPRADVLTPRHYNKSFGTFAEATVVSESAAEEFQVVAENVSEQASRDLPALLGCEPSESACIDGFIESFGSRAWRRPLDEAELALLRSVYDEVRAAGLPAREGVRAVIEVVLQSPQFLYLPEIAADGAGPSEVVPVRGYEMASRLSFALWIAPPDDVLLQAARDSELQTEAQIEAQARRMVEDPRAREVLAAFLTDLLGLLELRNSPKDTSEFPEYDDALADAMLEGFDRWVVEVWETGPTYENLMLSTDYPVDRRLAELYDVEPGEGDGWWTASVDPERRSGMLTQLAFLGAHAHASETHPVGRGAFIREQVLCQPQTVPDVDVDDLPTANSGLPIRERLAQHREDKGCAGCHALIDPPGFAFEHHDAVGAWRDVEPNGSPVDTTGELVAAGDATGPFDGASEMIERIAHSEIGQRCVATQWYRRTTGRPDVRQEDACGVKALQDEFLRHGGDVRELFVQMALTDAFRHRIVSPTEL